MTNVRFTIHCTTEEELKTAAKELARKGFRPYTYRVLSGGDSKQHEMGLVFECDIREKYKLEGYNGRLWNILFPKHYMHSLNGNVLELVEDIPKGDTTLKWTGLIFSTMYGQMLVCKRYDKEK